MLPIRAHVALPIILIAVFAACICLPYVVRAQATSSSSDLRSTIRAELLSDPRTGSLSQTELNAMVDLLVQEAQKRGVTAHDITWRPSLPPPAASGADESAACGNIPSPLCALNTAFGFAGSDSVIPIGLGITAAILLLLIGLMTQMHRRANPASAPVPPSVM